MSPPTAEPWWAATDAAGERGLRFECTGCGACCSGPPGYVRFTPAEAGAMAAALGVGVERFLLDYTEQGPAGLSLRDVKTEHGYDCVLLDRVSVPGKAMCRVYEARPAQCRAWPFWPEVLKSPHHWAAAAKNCEGINRGPLHAPEVIALTVRGK